MVRGWTGTSEQNNCSCMLRLFGRWSLRQDYSCGCKWKQCGRSGQPEGKKKGKKVRSGRYWSVRNRTSLDLGYQGWGCTCDSGPVLARCQR